MGKGLFVAELTCDRRRGWKSISAEGCRGDIVLAVRLCIGCGCGVLFCSDDNKIESAASSMMGVWLDASNEREPRSGNEADARCFGGGVASIVGDTEMSAIKDNLSACVCHVVLLQGYGASNASMWNLRG
jgi:hypothetical protein